VAYFVHSEQRTTTYRIVPVTGVFVLSFSRKRQTVKPMISQLVAAHASYPMGTQLTRHPI